ncbi:MAG: DegV family protein [Herpetosiphonaceae bacterium]|nr:DegV family protein [Herpetosiphonaceae bacterium]
MAGYVGTVVTDRRVLLGSDIQEQVNLAVLPRNVRIDGQLVANDERLNVVRAMAHNAIGRGRPPEVLPPDREQFLGTYQALAEQHPHLVSIHYLATLDGAAREARVCHQLMQPDQQIEVYEAKTLEGGLDFLLKSTLAMLVEGATTTQVLALLRYLETHMLTFLLTPGAVQAQPWATVSGTHRARSMVPATETLWHFDSQLRRLVPVRQSGQLHAKLGPLLQSRWSMTRYAMVVRYRGYTQNQIAELTGSLQRAGLEAAPHLEPIAATFLPCMPPRFIELLLLPTEADMSRLQGLIQNPIWWKGAA